MLNERFLCCVLFSPFCATAGGYDYVMINLWVELFMECHVVFCCIVCKMHYPEWIQSCQRCKMSRWNGQTFMTSWTVCRHRHLLLTTISLLFVRDFCLFVKFLSEEMSLCNASLNIRYFRLPFKQQTCSELFWDMVDSHWTHFTFIMFRVRITAIGSPKF